jgi:hypothetical protein
MNTEEPFKAIRDLCHILGMNICMKTHLSAIVNYCDVFQSARILTHGKVYINACNH